MATRVLRFTPTCSDTDPTAALAVVSNPEAIAGFTPTLGGATKIVNVAMHDSNDNSNKAFSIYFFAKGDNDLNGTLSSVVNITDANYLANVPFGRAELSGIQDNRAGDLVNSRLLQADCSIGVKSEKGSSEIFVAVVSDSSGGCTTSVSGIELIITVED